MGRQRILILLVGCVLALSACGGGEEPSAPGGATSAAAPSSAPAGPEASPSPSGGSDDDTPEPSSAVSSPSADDTGEAGSGDDGGNDDQNTGNDNGAQTKLPPRPAPDECVNIPKAGNDRYRVYNAGTAVVRHTGNRLRIGAVDPAAGWRDRIESRERDEVQIEFRKGRTRLELDVELDDGRFEAQICNETGDD